MSLMSMPAALSCHQIAKQQQQLIQQQHKINLLQQQIQVKRGGGSEAEGVTTAWRCLPGTGSDGRGKRGRLSRIRHGPKEGAHFCSSLEPQLSSPALREGPEYLLPYLGWRAGGRR